MQVRLEYINEVFRTRSQAGSLVSRNEARDVALERETEEMGRKREKAGAQRKKRDKSKCLYYIGKSYRGGEAQPLHCKVYGRGPGIPFMRSGQRDDRKILPWYVKYISQLVLGTTSYEK